MRKSQTEGHTHGEFKQNSHIEEFRQCNLFSPGKDFKKREEMGPERKKGEKKGKMRGEKKKKRERKRKKEEGGGRLTTATRNSRNTLKENHERCQRGKNGDGSDHNRPKKSENAQTATSRVKGGAGRYSIWGQ